MCRSIKKQLTWSVATALLSAILLVLVLFLVFYCYAGRKVLIEHTKTQSAVVRHMMAYSDGPSQTQGILSKLVSTDRNVDAIAVYHGRFLYASYPSNMPQTIEPPTKPVRFTLKKLYVSVPQENPPGEIHTVVNLSAFYQGLELVTLVLVILTLCSVGLAYSLAFRTAASIIRPLQSLSNLAEKISTSKSFEERFPVCEQEEVRRLALSLNGLLDKIQARDLEIERNTSNLEREINQRTEAIESAKRKAEQASKAKSTFLANMSHELRTPLTSIRMYSELVKEDLEEGSIDTKRHIIDLKKVLVASDHLLALIEDILDLAKIESGKTELNPEAFNLEHLLVEVVEHSTPLVERNQNKFDLVADISPDLIMFTDPTRLKQILFNLLSNSAKFTEFGLVTLRVTQLGEYIIFQVEDSGIGMTPDQVDRVWEEFVQADSSTSKRYGGTGLGLALTKRLSLSLGGSASMESTPHIGTVVTVKLPLQVQ